jgi:hypothetical protein
MTTCLGTGVQSLTYITTDHGELAQSVAEDIRNESHHGEGESELTKKYSISNNLLLGTPWLL